MLRNNVMLLGYIAIGFGFIAAIVGTIFIIIRKFVQKEFLPTTTMLFVLHAMMGAVANIAGFILSALIGNNHPRTHFYYLIDFILVMLMFSYWSPAVLFKRIIRWVLIPGYVLIWIFFKWIGIEDLFDRNSFTISAACLVIFVIGFQSISYVNQRLILNPLKNPFVLMCFSFIVYHFTVLCTRSLYFYLLETQNISLPGMFSSASIVNIILYGINVYAFYLCWKHKTDIELDQAIIRNQTPKNEAQKE